MSKDTDTADWVEFGREEQVESPELLNYEFLYVNTRTYYKKVPGGRLYMTLTTTDLSNEVVMSTTFAGGQA